ncbi:MAG: type IV pilus secretin PilQ [Desulfuromonadaceae bacterium]|nr:type IV pilus secretin PilQ [Desulfuromonadaceae bacterium]MDD5105320.1 type IV pilus secretin PilQ [Desulfuromonadaceae bacterium]
MKWKSHSLNISLKAIITGCLLALPGLAFSAGLQGTEKPAEIVSVTPKGTGLATELSIKLSSQATYTSYKTVSPLRLVIDFSQVIPGEITAPLTIAQGNFKTVSTHRFDSDAGVLTRMEIELLHDSEAQISVAQNNARELTVSFPALVASEMAAVAPIGKPPVVAEPQLPEPAAPVIAAPVPEVVPVAQVEHAVRTLTAISVRKNTITLALDGDISDFKTFRLNNPERYIIDLMNVKSGLTTRLLPLNSSGVASARLGIYPDKVRVVLDAVNGTFPEATTVKTETGVVISLGVKDAEKRISPAPVAEIVPVVIPPKETLIAAEPAPEVIKPEPATQTAVEQNKPIAAGKTKQQSTASVVEMIDFQVIDNITRISVKVNGDINASQPVKTAGYVTLTLKNAVLPKNLQRSIETRSFVSPVLRITPLLIKNKKGTDTKIRIATRVAAPYEYRQEGDMLYIDFTHPEELSGDKLVVEAAGQKIKVPAAQPVLMADDEIASNLAPTSESTAKNLSATDTSRSYKGRKVSLEFADAEVRKIFQLLSEVSNKNFVLGDEVTGAISLKLVNVPWDQALDIILDTKNLDKREDGNIILIRGKGKFKSQAEEDLDIKRTQLKNEPLFTEYFAVNYSKSGTIKPQLESLITANTGKISEDERTNTLIVTAIRSDIDKIKTFLERMDVPERQVMIEARIVEAESSFLTQLGISWGHHYRDGAAQFLGINQLDTSFGGLTNAPVTAGQSGVAGANVGIAFGRLNSNIQLDMRLNAAATAGMVKIVSTPKIATLNNKTAKITQGQSIPYQNTTSTAGATTQFVQAVLSLEVKPHINANGTISLEIKATNNSAGAGNPPPINTKEATTEMLLKDGETTVIGGIYKEDETVTESGVPYLMDIPYLGRLFKSTDTSKIKTELLIFITPRILNQI